MKVVPTLIGACLLWLASSAFATPINPIPDLQISNIQVGTTLITCNVDSIIDHGLCTGGCHFGGNFTIDTSLLLNVYGTDPSDVYLTGLLDLVTSDNSSVTLFMEVLFDDNHKWSQVEGQTATPFGEVIAFNIRNFHLTGGNNGDDSGDDSGDDGGDDDHGHDGDIGPCRQTPEPASCVLVIGGIAAGLIRRRLTTK
jgi:hypothetical protein